MSIDSKLFIQKISLNRDKVPSFKEYPFSIPVIKDMDTINIDSPVTFFVGENGSGKSTLMEAIAVFFGLNPEGGTQNFNFKTKDTHSGLSDYIRIAKFNTPHTKFFLRAESFYNFSSEIERLVEENQYHALRNYYGGSLHECSHGESFLQLVKNRFTDHGLYILDEPEAALSPQRQLSLLYLIDKLAKEGSQFIIATHSPILISYRDGKILDLNNNFKEVKYKETDIYNLYKMYLDEPDIMQHRLFDD
jgi:predicted ATPase